ncbi:MAG TPA: O-antigen ligase family protein [Solirubrobacteraceae bacterium]|jgi:hypothetical protein
MSQLPVVPAFLALAIMVVWAAHDGGYDQDTWYWGALVILGLLAALVVLGLNTPLRHLSTGLKVALGAFALYVAWSYLSITWASSKGDALDGSNRALLYLLVLTLFALTPWTALRARAAMLAYALSITVIALVVLIAMASGHRAGSLFSEGRLISPTGYFNSAAALFMTAAFMGTSLAIRRDLPALLRGVLLGGACASLQLVLLAESRGWLFTLPFLLVAAVAVSRDRIRVAFAAALPTIATLAALGPLLDVFRAAEAAHPTARAFSDAVAHAGKISLALSAGVLVIGAVLAVIDGRVGPRRLPTLAKRALGSAMILVAIVIATAGGLVATHGHPARFVSRQWRGFTNQSSGSDSASSHFASVGSGRYDAWRVALHAVSAHPIGGLGQDNFADYYVRHRHTSQEYQWTHSWEMRVLAHTGIVGAILYLTFLVGAFTAALRSRRRLPPSPGQLAGIALLPVLVWLIHGSVDWFWETPALSGPALGFLAMGGALLAPHRDAAAKDAPRHALLRPLAWAGAGVALVAAVVVLGFPYLSVRKVSSASNARSINPAAAISDLRTAAKLNPLEAAPDRVAGTIALENGNFTEAVTFFQRAIQREPGGWFAYLGAGLAASTLGNEGQAHRFLQQAAAINNKQPAVTEALARVNSTHPLTLPEALRLLIYFH